MDNISVSLTIKYNKHIIYTICTKNGFVCFYQVRCLVFEDRNQRKDCQTPFLAGWQVIRVLAEKGLEVQKRNDRGDCPLICATWSSEMELSKSIATLGVDHQR